jgi:hypothetical protein
LITQPQLFYSRLQQHSKPAVPDNQTQQPFFSIVIIGSQATATTIKNNSIAKDMTVTDPR